jgi:hypothetical protein
LGVRLSAAGTMSCGGVFLYDQNFSMG